MTTPYLSFTSGGNKNRDSTSSPFVLTPDLSIKAQLYRGSLCSPEPTVQAIQIQNPQGPQAYPDQPSDCTEGDPGPEEAGTLLTSRGWGCF